MNSFQKIASVVALLQAVAIGTLLVVLLGLLPSIGVTPNDLHNPAKMLPAINSPLLGIYYALFPSFGITVIILALAMNSRLQGKPRGLTRLFLATSVIGAIGYTTYGIVGRTMISAFNQLVQSNPTAANEGVVSALAVLSGAITIAGASAVTTTALWGWATLKAGVLPKLLCYLIIAASLARYVTLVVAFPPLIIFNLGGSVVWGIWLGIVLLRGQPSAAAASSRVTATANNQEPVSKPAPGVE